MTTVIGYTLEKAANKNFIFMYFRDANGFKYKISGYEENISGAKDLRNCSTIKEMSSEEYDALPDKIANEDIIENLLKEVNTWMIEHPNRYSRDRYEDAYWTMLNLREILQDNPNEKTIEACKAIFKRNRFIY